MNKPQSPKSDFDLKKIFSLTIPIMKSTFKHHKFVIFGFVIFSALISFVPSIKSEIESAIISQINDNINKKNTNSILTEDLNDLSTQQKPSFSDIISFLKQQKLKQFHHDSSLDLRERISAMIFGNTNFLISLFIYFIIIFIIYFLSVTTTTFRTRITQELFTQFQKKAILTCLTTESCDLPEDTMVAGKNAMAIQQGAYSIGETFGSILVIGQYILTFITSLIIVWNKNVYFAFGCLFLAGIQIIISKIQASHLLEKRESLDKNRNNLQAKSNEILSKRELLLAFDQETKYSNKIVGLTEEYAKVDRSLVIRESWYRGFSNVIDDFSRILILLIAFFAVFWTIGSAVSSIGDAYFLISLYSRLLLPINNLLNTYDSIKRSAATSKMFFKIIEQYKEEHLTKNNYFITVPENLNITFDNVCFSYKKTGNNILNNCSFFIPSCKTTLVLGRSGSGKSSIAKIIMRFWPISSGVVTIAGKDIKAWSPQQLRGLIGYVSQSDHIIDETVRDNLQLGYRKDHKLISDDEMLNVLVRVGIIDNSNKRSFLDTNAQILSGGQQQRLSIARLYLDQSPIILLDEPLAGVDLFTTQELQPVMTEILTNNIRTAIIFSHRLSYANYANRIIILNKDGAVDEAGTPHELFYANGTFADLYSVARQEIQFEDMTIIDNIKEG